MEVYRKIYHYRRSLPFFLFVFVFVLFSKTSSRSAMVWIEMSEATVECGKTDGGFASGLSACRLHEDRSTLEQPCWQVVGGRSSETRRTNGTADSATSTGSNGVTARRFSSTKTDNIRDWSTESCATHTWLLSERISENSVQRLTAVNYRSWVK